MAVTQTLPHRAGRSAGLRRKRHASRPRHGCHDTSVDPILTNSSAILEAPLTGSVSYSESCRSSIDHETSPLPLLSPVGQSIARCGRAAEHPLHALGRSGMERAFLPDAPRHAGLEKQHRADAEHRAARGAGHEIQLGLCASAGVLADTHQFANGAESGGARVDEGCSGGDGASFDRR